MTSENGYPRQGGYEKFLEKPNENYNRWEFYPLPIFVCRKSYPLHSERHPKNNEKNINGMKVTSSDCYGKTVAFS